MKRLGVTVSNQKVDGREENPPGSFLRSRFNYLAQLWRKLQKPKRTCVLSSSRRQSEIQFAHCGFGLEWVSLALRKHFDALVTLARVAAVTHRS
jgi:hypothetical protein